MSKFNIGDKVCFIEDEKGRIFTVSGIYEDDSIELEELGSVYPVSENTLKLVKRCPYQPGDRVKLTAVYWLEEENCFKICEIMGTMHDGGYIQFDKRTYYGHSFVSVSQLNTIRTTDFEDVYCDCAFCEPGEENVRKVKLEYLRMLASEVKSLKKDYEYAHNQLKAMYQQIVQ